MAKEKKFLYPIFKLPREYHDGIQVREIPKYIKWWLYNNYKKKHGGVLSDILLGTNFTLTDSLNRLFNIYEVQGNTLQEGTPAPDNECTIYNVTGNVRNYVTSKNYQISEWEVGSISGGNGANQSSTTRLRTKDFIEIPNKTLKCFIVGNISHVNIFEYNLSNVFIQSSGWKNNDYEFTPSENTKYIRILCQNNGNTITLDDVKLSFVYENMQNLPLTLGNTELCRIPNTDYKDYYFKNIKGSKYYNSELTENKWYLHKEIGKVVLDGSEEWEYAEQYNYFRVSSYNFTDIPLDTVLQLSNYFICIGVWSTFRDNTNLNGFFKVHNIGYKLAFRNTNFDNVTDFKNWLATHNTKVYYPLETPTNTEVTNTTLIQQLEATLQAYTYAEETNISSTSDGASPILKIQYWKKESENINPNIINAIKNSEEDEEDEEIDEDINVDNEEIEEDIEYDDEDYNDFEESEVDDT